MGPHTELSRLALMSGLSGQLAGQGDLDHPSPEAAAAVAWHLATLHTNTPTTSLGTVEVQVLWDGRYVGPFTMNQEDLTAFLGAAGGDPLVQEVSVDGVPVLPPGGKGLV